MIFESMKTEKEKIQFHFETFISLDFKAGTIYQEGLCETYRTVNEKIWHRHRSLNTN